MDTSTYAIALLVLALAWIVAFIRDKTDKGTAEVKLNNLIRLSKSNSIKEDEEFAQWSSTCTRSAELSWEAETYCALTVVKDFSEEGLKEKDYTVMKWRLDFVRPDRFHITQELWDCELGDLYDQWVTIGKDNYQNAGLWFHDEDGRHDGINQGLLVNKYLGVIRNQAPERYSAHRYLGERFLLLEYDPRAFPEQHAEIIDLCKEVQQGTCEFHIWINIDTGYFAKAQVKIQGTSNDGDRVDAELHSVFTCYNEKITITPPPWLNAVSDSGGSNRIVNTEVPILPHHE